MTTSPTRPFVFRWTDSIEHDASLSTGARHCALALAREMNLNGEHCFPSKMTLSVRMGCSERTVARKLNELKDAGWLSWQQRRRRGSVHLMSNNYVPTIPQGCEVDSRGDDFLTSLLSEDSTGDVSKRTPTYTDIDNDAAIVIDATCVWIRNHFQLTADHSDGYLKFVDAVTEAHHLHGRDGLLRLADILSEQTTESLSNAVSPLRVLAHRVESLIPRLHVDTPALPLPITYANAQPSWMPQTEPR